MKLINKMSVVALLLNSSNQVDIRSRSKFLDDKLYDDDLPMGFHFVNEPDEDELEKVKDKGNDFIAGVNEVKGFSDALDMVSDDSKLEHVVKEIDKKHE